ncbi:MAG: YveK family protein [Mycobacterium leprae]
MEQTELDLREIFYILKRRLWLLILLPVVAAVTAGLVSLFVLSPVYSATTTLWVVKDTTGGQALQYNDLLMSQSLTKTYAQVAKSRTVVERAIKTLGLNLSVQDVQAALTVTPVQDTQILSFAVQQQDPALAAKLADGLAESFMAQISSFVKIENVKIVDRAQVPASPVSPRKTLNVAIAFVLGLMAAVGLAFLLEYLDTTIKTPEDVARYLNLPVLGSIPDIGQVTEAGPRRHRKHVQTRTVVEK